MLSGFVTFEGVDGSGKTTVSRLVVESLRKNGNSVYMTSEPTHTWLGDAVRRTYEDDVGPITESFLFLADRAAHTPEIRAHLAKRELVVCDRYADSTFAYQGARLRGIVRDPLRFLQRASDDWLLMPDVTVLLKIPPALGLKRIAGRASRARFENITFLRKVATNYNRLAQAPRFVVIDGTRDANAVATDAIAAIRQRLTKRRRR